MAKRGLSSHASASRALASCSLVVAGCVTFVSAPVFAKDAEAAAPAQDEAIPAPPPSSDEDGEGPQMLARDFLERGIDYKRWTTVGPFVGMVSRPSKSSEITYQVGTAYGGFFRPQITPWLGLRLLYREERIPVTVAPGAFDVDGESLGFPLEQPDLKVTSIGVHLEPTWNLHPRFRLTGVLGWSWLRFVAPMPEAPEFDLRASRAGVEMNWTLGAGLAFDVIPHWVDVTMTLNHSFITGRSGSAYEPIQAVVDGEITHLGPLPEFKSATDLIFYFGLIL